MIGNDKILGVAHSDLKPDDDHVIHLLELSLPGVEGLGKLLLLLFHGKLIIFVKQFLQLVVFEFLTSRASKLIGIAIAEKVYTIAFFKLDRMVGIIIHFAIEVHPDRKFVGFYFEECTILHIIKRVECSGILQHSRIPVERA